MEKLKVFKNVNGVQMDSVDGIFPESEIVILETGPTETAVIKDISLRGLVTGAEVDMDGYVIGSGTDFTLEGNLIVDNNSRVVIKTQEALGYTLNDFIGLFFTVSTTGIQKLIGDGQSKEIVPTKISTQTSSWTDATGVMIDGTPTFIAHNTSNQVVFHDVDANILDTQALGSTGYCITNDENYLYKSASGSTSTIYRMDLRTKVTDTITLNQTYASPNSNQGSYFLYHNGFIYSKSEGASTVCYKISLATGNVTTISGSLSVGGYSDGAAITTTRAGTTYLIEQGTTYWTYLDLETEVVVSVGQGSGASTEYGQGGSEIAPGIVLIFGEETDSATIIDVNDLANIVHIHDDGAHGYTTDTAYGNYYGFAGILTKKSSYTYNLFSSGIYIIEDV